MVFPRLQALCDNSAGHAWQAAGYRFILSAVLGDLKWMNQHYGIHNFRSNFPCSLCRVCKVTDSVGDSICDFRPTAAHLRTSISHEQFIASLDPAKVPLPCRFGFRFRGNDIDIKFCLSRLSVFFFEGFRGIHHTVSYSIPAGWNGTCRI